ncbi:hypothetical protein DPMN_192178 [Dreissena polymorpha]|uniref:Uncharacterized protein n=1 Tax=Dreissena polymorpha TaxID=45954 RepID=A0A9D4BC64_DREPO|nr:hypothetical protein DPMN_192178 [Dreissena polymorpha]
MFFCFNIVINATQSSVAQCSLWIPHRLTTPNHVNGDGLRVAGRGRKKALVWARSQKYPRKAGKPLIWLGNSLSGQYLVGTWDSVHLLIASGTPVQLGWRCKFTAKTDQAKALLSCKVIQNA